METKTLSVEERKQHITNGVNEPALYVGTYKKYNEGSLAGAWVNLATFEDAEEFFDFCRRLHGDESDPELMFQDYENFPELLYSECMDEEDIDRIIALFRDYDEDDRDAIFEYWDEIDSKATPSYILDHMIWHGDFEEYANETADEMLHGVDSWVTNYFDYAAFARDLRYDYNITSNFVFCN